MDRLLTYIYSWNIHTFISFQMYRANLGKTGGRGLCSEKKKVATFFFFMFDLCIYLSVYYNVSFMCYIFHISFKVVLNGGKLAAILREVCHLDTVGLLWQSFVKWWHKALPEVAAPV